MTSNSPRVLGAVLLAMGLTGCVTSYGPGGTLPGLFHSNVTYPNSLNPNMSYRILFDRGDIELLDKVEATSSSRWYFFFYSTGDSGYAQLMREALKEGGDGVMNVTVDTQYTSYFLFYAKVTTKLSGLAYRYRRLDDDGFCPRESTGDPKGTEQRTE